MGQLVRDLLSIDERDELLHGFSGLDLLLLTELVTSRPMLRKAFSETLADQVDDWASRADQKSVLFQQWIRGKKGFSRAAEIMGSLGIPATTKGPNRDEATRKQGYLAMLRTIVLWQRAHGALPADLERRWKINDLDEIQEQWRDDRLFLLGAMKNLWEIRCFFYHLKEDCGAGDERILRVKRIFQRIQVLTNRLMNLIAWCSALGPVFVRLRQSRPTGGKPAPAQAAMRRLQEVGIADVTALRACSFDDLKKHGIRKDIAAQIVAFMRR